MKLKKWAYPAAYFMSVAVVSILVSLVAGWVPSILLGILLAIYMVLAGFFLFRNRVSSPARSSWWNVMPCYLTVQDERLRIIEANDLFRRDFKSGPGEYCYSAYKHRESPCPNCPVLRTFETGKNHTSEETVIMNSGDVADVVVTSTPLVNGQGKITAVVEMSTNVTEVKTLHQRLKRSKQNYNQLFDIVPCYISIQDRDFQIVQSNKLFRHDFGECTRMHCYQAYKGNDTICDDCPVEKSFADGEMHDSEETVITKDGRQASMIVNTMPILNSSGEVTAVMEVSTNITEVKRLQALATVGLAVTGMAHRIKNVLMGLKGGIFVVNTGFETDDKSTVDEGWQMLERNVDKVSHITSDLLLCSKDRQPKLEDNVSPETIMREVYDLYLPRASHDNIELTLEVEDVPHHGTFDPDGLHRLVMNLVGNAMDACRFDPAAEHKKHVIKLRCVKDRAEATVIEVADNGSGIPDELSNKVFEGFFSTKGTEGTGLGLLVVQKVVEEHEGNISFTSKEGEGTMFKVVLPSHKKKLATRILESGGPHETENPCH